MPDGHLGDVEHLERKLRSRLSSRPLPDHEKVCTPISCVYRVRDCMLGILLHLHIPETRIKESISKIKHRRLHHLQTKDKPKSFEAITEDIRSHMSVITALPTSEEPLTLSLQTLAYCSDRMEIVLHIDIVRALEQHLVHILTKRDETMIYFEIAFKYVSYIYVSASEKDDFFAEANLLMGKRNEDREAKAEGGCAADDCYELVDFACFVLTRHLIPASKTEKP